MSDADYDRLTAEGLTVCLRVFSEQHAKLRAADADRKELLRLIDRMGKRMAKQRADIGKLINLLIARNGGTRRARAPRLL